jgi:large subunit ribosomal protein L25
MAIEVVAQSRKVQGRGASRRLRHAGKVPGILYGGKAEPVNIELDQNSLYHQLRDEKFHASILTLSLDGSKQEVLLRAVNMHPWKTEVQHIDQRVSADQKIHIRCRCTSSAPIPAIRSRAASSLTC